MKRKINNEYITLMQCKDMMDLVRLNKIEFGRVELQKIILGLAGSF